MDSRTLLKEHVIPGLRAMGFQGSFPHFRRITAGGTHLLSFQLDKWGSGDFVVELAKAPAGPLTLPSGETLPAQKLTAHHVVVRLRLGAKDAGSDHWFRHRRLAADSGAVARELLRLVETQGNAWWGDATRDGAAAQRGARPMPDAAGTSCTLNRRAEHAVEYTRRERIRFLAVSLTLGAAAMAACQYWFFPWLRDFASSAHCRVVFGIPGSTALWYGLFFGLPLSVAALLAGTAGRRGLKILREGRVPPVGEKVFRPTVIRRGTRARVVGYAHLVLVLFSVVLALWGLVQATQFDEAVPSLRGDCATDNPSRPG